MKITAQLAFWASIVFAVICLGVALSGFSQLDSIEDEATRADGRGYALFWLFLGTVAVASALASRWVAKREDDDASER